MARSRRARPARPRLALQQDDAAAFLTAEDVSRLLHLHVKRVQLLARSRRLPAVQIGRRWLFPRARLLASLRGAASPAADPGVALSARNRLRGSIVSLALDGVMAEVRIQVGDQDLVAIITRASAEGMRLRVGDQVQAVIKATEVMVGKPLS